MVPSDYNKFTEEKLCYNLSKSLNIWARNLGNPQQNYLWAKGFKKISIQHF